VKEGGEGGREEREREEMKVGDHMKIQVQCVSWQEATQNYSFLYQS